MYISPTKIRVFTFICLLGLSVILYACQRCTPYVEVAGTQQIRRDYRALGDGWKLDSLFIAGKDSTLLLTQLNAAGATMNFSDYDVLVTSTRDECAYFAGYQAKSSVTDRMSASMQTSAMLSLSTLREFEGRPASVSFHLNVEARDLTTNQITRLSLPSCDALSNSVVNGKLYMYCRQVSRNNRSVWLVFSR